MKYLITIVTCASALIGAFALSGCGPSAEETKRQEAVSRLTNRPKPGYVRVLNLSSSPVEVRDQARALSGPIEPNSSNRLMPVGIGKKKITLKIGAKSVDVDVDLVSGEGSTIVVGAAGVVLAIVSGEPWRPQDEGNVLVAFVGQKGGLLKSGSATVSGPSGSQKLEPSSGVQALNEGEWSGSAGSSITVEPKLAYTFLFVESSPGKFISHLLLNTNNDKPAAASPQ